MKTFIVVILLAVMTASTNRTLAQSGYISWSALDGGFGLTASGNTRLESNLGQTFVGNTSSAGETIRSGFLVYRFRSPLTSGVQSPPASDIPGSYALYQNYPNPFNPGTRITFDVPRQSRVAIHVYNILGENVATLLDETRQPGRFSATWDPVGISSGVYFCRMQAGNFVATRRMLLVR